MTDASYARRNTRLLISLHVLKALLVYCRALSLYVDAVREMRPVVTEHDGVHDADMGRCSVDLLSVMCLDVCFGPCTLNKPESLHTVEQCINSSFLTSVPLIICVDKILAGTYLYSVALMT